MSRGAIASLFLAALLSASPASAVTNQDGQVLITQAAVNAGNITPGDTPGFPVTISIGGSYRLASNLVVTSAVNGIEVRANEVSIDMGGFTLVGSGVGRNGIASFNRSLRVAGGNVRGFTNDGIRTIAQHLSVSDMLVTRNGRHGIFADPQGPFTDTVAFASIAGSKVTANTSNGIICGENCRVENSLISGNGASGVSFYGLGGLALGNTVTQNSGGFGLSFVATGGAGNNTVLFNGNPQISGAYVPMQPNACLPACPPPP